MKVSIVVPMYNVERYIERCLQSLISQTMSEIEIIVVDDGSKDQSYTIAKKISEKDSRIKIVRKENGGLSDARNFGLQYAVGEYVAFVDSDDYVESDMYEIMYECAKKEDSDIVECDFFWEYPTKVRVDKSRLTKPYIPKIRVVAWNKIYKMDLLKKTNVLFPVGLRYEDVAFCYQLLPYVSKISTVHQSFYHYIQRSESISNTQNEKVEDIYKVLQIVFEYYHTKTIWEEYREQLEYVTIRYILGSSFLRAVQIPNKSVRNRILKAGWFFLKLNFPNWKKNGLLKEDKTKKGFYFKIMNYQLYLLSSVIIRLWSKFV